MKDHQIQLSNHSLVAAFIIGVILFAAFWKFWFGSASSAIVLAGMAGVALTVISFWLWSILQHTNNKEE